MIEVFAVKVINRFRFIAQSCVDQGGQITANEFLFGLSLKLPDDVNRFIGRNVRRSFYSLRRYVKNPRKNCGKNETEREKDRRRLSSCREAHRTSVEKSMRPGSLATRQKHMPLRLCKPFAALTRRKTYSPSLGRFAHRCHGWDAVHRSDGIPIHAVYR